MIPLLLAMVMVVDQSLAQMAAQVAHHPTAAGYRALAIAYEEAGEYPLASIAYQQAADRYERLGDINAAIVLHEQSLRYATELSMFVQQPYADAPGPYLARLEPAYGCYVGANIEWEDGPRDPADFNQQIGKPQATFFIYRKYGMPFPADYARELRSIGAGLQIAWEPSSLADVRDDDYLRSFLSDARRPGIPVFLRFASEMNGDWTPYHGDPQAYIRSFRLVAGVAHQQAPNCAMVWCPNDIPESTIPSYFPGDDAVDWVGVNFYSVLYNDGDRDRVATWQNPADALAYIYRTYADRHPIMIGEWAASHMSVVDHADRTDFAVDKIGQLYASLPRLYPRVKAVHWLSMNTEKWAEGDRRLNDFCLLDDSDVAAAYGKAISPDYFLSSVTMSDATQRTDPPTHRIVPLSKDTVVSGTTVVSAVVRCYDPHPRVTYSAGGQIFDAGNATGPYEATIDTTRFPNGPLNLTIQATDQRERLAGSASVTVMVKNP